MGTVDGVAAEVRPRATDPGVRSREPAKEELAYESARREIFVRGGEYGLIRARIG